MEIPEHYQKILDLEKNDFNGFCPSCGVPGCADTPKCWQDASLAHAYEKGQCNNGHTLTNNNKPLMIEPDGPVFCPQCMKEE